MTDSDIYVLERVFDAPPALVWRTWTEADLLARWYGPNVETVIHKLDVRPGGVWLNEMRFGKRSNFERMDYVEVVDTERLVWRHSMTDDEWNVVANPHMPDWPRVLTAEVQLTEQAGRTHMRFSWTPCEATDAERACFTGAMGGFAKGWGSGMDLLADILVELQA